MVARCFQLSKTGNHHQQYSWRLMLSTRSTLIFHRFFFGKPDFFSTPMTYVYYINFAGLYSIRSSEETTSNLWRPTVLVWWTDIDWNITHTSNWQHDICVIVMINARMRQHLRWRTLGNHLDSVHQWRVLGQRIKRTLIIMFLVKTTYTFTFLSPSFGRNQQRTKGKDPKNWIR